MNAAQPRPVRVAILAFPEVTASIVYGFYDLFLSVGRDWEVIVAGRPGPSLMQPIVVSRLAEPFAVANGVRVVPEATLADAPLPEVVCVPEVALPPGEPLDGFTAEIAWLQRCYMAGATIATACSGAMLLAQAGLLDGHDATTHWAWCNVMRAPSTRARASAADDGRQRRRPAIGDGRGRRRVARRGDLPDLALCRAGGRDANGAHQFDRVARGRPATVRTAGTNAPV
jgi:transcriptional regulator GlxA family with amidase domain